MVQGPRPLNAATCVDGGRHILRSAHEPREQATAILPTQAQWNTLIPLAKKYEPGHFTNVRRSFLTI